MTIRTGYELREGAQMIQDRAVALGTLPARKPARHSQCERILAVLADGDLHTTAEIHQRAGYSRLNSRIAELRKRGWNIAYEFVGGVGPSAHAYRLICAEGSAGTERVVVSPLSDDAASAQLSLGAVA